MLKHTLLVGDYELHVGTTQVHNTSVAETWLDFAEVDGVHAYLISRTLVSDGGYICLYQTIEHATNFTNVQFYIVGDEVALNDGNAEYAPLNARYQADALKEYFTVVMAYCQ